MKKLPQVLIHILERKANNLNTPTKERQEILRRILELKQQLKKERK